MSENELFILSKIEEAIQEVNEEEKKHIAAIKDIANNLANDIIDAINNESIEAFDGIGYYSIPVISTKYGKILFGNNAVEGLAENRMYMSTDWTEAFYTLINSRKNNISYMDSLTDPEVFVKGSNAIAETIKNSSFFLNEDPYTLIEPFSADTFSGNSISIVLNTEYENFNYLANKEEFNLIIGLSIRKIHKEVNEFYVNKILPEIKFTSEEVKLDCLKGIKVVSRKITNTKTGNSFFTISGNPKDLVKAVNVPDIKVISDDGVMLQQTYARIANTFLKNEWWHPYINTDIIENVEKIFIPDVLCKNSDEICQFALTEMERIRKELFPDNGVLALPSLVNYFSEISHTNSPEDFVYLDRFLKKDALVSNIDIASLDSVDEEKMKKIFGDTKFDLECGLLAKDALRSNWKGIMSLPLIPELATVIVEELPK